jgi:tetratricopeptide (TPR) repeat protein
VLERYTHLREDHLRYMQKWGVVRPSRENGETIYAFSDLAVLRQADAELAEGKSFRAVLRNLVAARDGQLAFDFRLEAQPAKVLQLTRRVPPPMAALMEATPREAALREAALREGTLREGTLREGTLREGTPWEGTLREETLWDAAPRPGSDSAEQLFLAASILDNGDPANFDEACAVYRRGLEIDPYMVPALINLANIHYARDEIAEAQALYERAIALEPDVFEAHFNLGNILHDLGRYPKAQACYRDALRLNPAYPDAHFYLAVTLEKNGQSHDARPHWKAYQQLAPAGEWVHLAKEFSD